MDTGDVAASKHLQDLGFCVIDTNVQLSLTNLADFQFTSSITGYQFREAKESDRPAVEAIAGDAFSQTRFHLDPLISNHVADGLKAKWAGNYFSGERGDGMIVALKDTEVVGFLQYFVSDRSLTIDLIAVSERHRGKGIGSAMIALAGNPKEPLQKMIVGTQISNTRSLRTYERLGFRICSSSYILHYHGAVCSVSAG